MFGMDISRNQALFSVITYIHMLFYDEFFVDSRMIFTEREARSRTKRYRDFLTSRHRIPILSGYVVHLAAAQERGDMK